MASHKRQLSPSRQGRLAYLEGTFSCPLYGHHKAREPCATESTMPSLLCTPSACRSNTTYSNMWRRDERIHACTEPAHNPLSPHPKASGDHPQAFGNTRQSGLWWASSMRKISRNIRKVPHRARTVRQHPHGAPYGEVLPGLVSQKTVKAAVLCSCWCSKSEMGRFRPEPCSDFRGFLVSP